MEFGVLFYVVYDVTWCICLGFTYIFKYLLYMWIRICFSGVLRGYVFKGRYILAGNWNFLDVGHEYVLRALAADGCGKQISCSFAKIVLYVDSSVENSWRSFGKINVCVWWKPYMSFKVAVCNLSSECMIFAEKIRKKGEH